MYIRPVHAVLDEDTLYSFIRSYPLGLFTTSITHPGIQTLQTSHIPFILDTPNKAPATASNSVPPSEVHTRQQAVVPGSFPSTSGNVDSRQSKGTLRGHIARANPQTKALLAALDPSTSSLDHQVLIIFNAPVNSYVTPKFYVESKPKDGKVVPTWNYAAVQVYGRVKIHHRNNEETSEFLQQQVEDLTTLGESRVKGDAGREEGEWKISDAPTKYVEGLKRGIVGLEVEIETIEGRFKLSQEDTLDDWRGVVQGFMALGTREGELMAGMIEASGRGREDEGSRGVVA